MAKTKPVEKFNCECCQRDLDPKTMVWLELNCMTLEWARQGKWPEKESQGLFPFGRACAKRKLAEQRRKVTGVAGQVQEKLQRIETLKDSDPEVAHSVRDDLYVFVLEYVATKAATGTIKNLAKLALQAKAIKLRWEANA